MLRMRLNTDKLKKIRKEQMSQEAFSEKIDVAAGYYAKIENAYCVPSVSVFLNICYNLNKSAQYFLEEGDMFLSSDQQEKLMQYSEERLQLISDLLQELYEKEKNYR